MWGRDLGRESPEWRCGISILLAAGQGARRMTREAAIVHAVDDDASFRTAIARLLGASGYRVAIYDSASALLEKLPGGGPGCILLDVKMSGLNGPQLQERLGELGHRLPIVFLTGYGDVPTGVGALKGGAEDFLTKAVAKKDLLAASGRALDAY